MLRNALLFATAIACIGAPAIAQSEKPKPIEVSASYVVDGIATVSGGVDRRARALDNLDLVLEGDLEQLIGWSGGSFHVDVLNNLGTRPNDGAATLQGVDNIEVSSHRVRLFEIWLEQSLGKGASIRAGLYDVNSEFYANESAGLLIAPAFGIGSEVAATGPNGPSIFPSTALAVRVAAALGTNGYARAAVINAHAGVLGDPGGVNFGFDNGLLVIAEAGVQAKGKIALGYWRYTTPQDDIRLIDQNGNPLRQTGQGAYLLAEYPLTNEDGPHATSAFVRLGVADGKTTAFSGGWQAGFLMRKVFAHRPDSQLSLGINQGLTTGRFEANQSALGIRPTNSETQFELTYSDKIAQFFTIQPDVQLILNPGADKAARSAVVVGMRASFEF